MKLSGIGNKLDFIKRDMYCFKTYTAKIGIGIFVAFVLTQRWLDVNPDLRWIQLIIVCLSFLFLAVEVLAKDFIKNKITIIDLIWIPAVIVIFGFVYFTNFNYFDIFTYGAGFGFLLLAKTDIKNFVASLNIAKFIAIVYALSSIVQYFFTDSFNNFVGQLTEHYSVGDIYSLSSRNYYPGLALTRPALAGGQMVVGLGHIIAFWKDYKKGRFIDLTIYLTIFLGLLMTNKRSIIIWSLIVLPIVYIALGVGKDRLKRFIRVLVVGAVATIALFVFLYFYETPQFISRMDSLLSGLIVGEIDASVGIRFTLYRDAWETFLENPLFGIGWQQFELMHPTEYSVHNVYLQLLAEMGLLGFILIAVPLFYTYGLTFNMLRLSLENEGRIDPLWKQGLTYSFYYQTFFLLYSISENPFYHLFFILFYFVMVAVVNSFVLLEKYNLVDEKYVIDGKRNA